MAFTHLHLRHVFTRALGALLLTAALASAARADVVTDWNAAMLEACRTANLPPFPITRVGAIVHTAVYDAVNGIERRTTPLIVAAHAPAGASLRAAATEAACVTLTALFPPQAETFQPRRTASLAALATTESAAAIAAGVAWGRTVGQAVLAARAQDGFGATGAPYQGGTAPGQWRPTAPGFAPGAFADFAQLTPWAITDRAAYLLPAPLTLGSAEYARDFNETKSLGGLTSTQRTPEQTTIARFWGTLPPAHAWNTVAVALATEQQLPLVETARLLATLNVTMADATIVCFYAKYQYGFWRPETAIAQADLDNNAATGPEAGWAPLLVAPPFPEHASAHSVASGSAAAVLTRTFGANTAFSVSSYALPGVTRSFATFAAAVTEVGDARVYGGIHFRHACDAGRAAGAAVAEEVMARSLQPLPNVGSLSARGSVGDGEQALIVGLIVSGHEPRRYLVRALGPTLAALGVAQPLGNPRLRIHNGTTFAAENDDWTGAAIAAAGARVGLVPLAAGSKDAALIVTLAPGAHTFVVTGAAGERGIALVEAYPMP